MIFWDVYTSWIDYHNQTIKTELPFCVVKALEIYYLSKFQVYNTLLLTIVTMMYIRSLEFIHLTSESLYTLSSVSPCLSPPAPGSHHSTFCYSEFNFFRFHISEILQYLSLYWLILLSLCWRCQMHSGFWRLNKSKIFIKLILVAC